VTGEDILIQDYQPHELNKDAHLINHLSKCCNIS